MASGRTSPTCWNAIFAIRSAFLLGAERVLAIDTVAERLDLAREAGAETIDFMKEDVYDRIMEFTKGDRDRGLLCPRLAHGYACG